MTCTRIVTLDTPLFLLSSDASHPSNLFRLSVEAHGVVGPPPPSQPYDQNQLFLLSKTCNKAKHQCVATSQSLETYFRISLLSLSLVSIILSSTEKGRIIIAVTVSISKCWLLMEGPRVQTKTLNMMIATTSEGFNFGGAASKEDQDLRVTR